jgi:putative ABC transport system permease protein
MITLLDSIKFGIRMLTARPFMTLIAVITMSIGIGITSSQIMIYQGLMVPKLPFPEPEEIVSIRINRGSDDPSGFVHQHLYKHWNDYQATFDTLFTNIEGTINVFYQNKATRYSGSWVSTNFIEGIGVEPFMGEGFKPGDDAIDAPNKVILSHGIWATDFSSDPTILGREILVNGESAMVVGIMPHGFKFPYNSEIWIPDKHYPGHLVAFDSTPGAMVFGRLSDEVDREVASGELTRLKNEFLSQVPTYYDIAIAENHSIEAISFIDHATDQTTRMILILSTTVVVLVLLIACANVTNLLLAGFSTRLKEIAIRNAVGATREHIALQLWIESFLVAFAGGAVALIYCLWTSDWGNNELSSMEVPFWYRLSFSPELFLAVFGISTASGFIAGLLPVLKFSKLSISQVLSDDSRTASSLSIGITHRTLVVLQISISCALLIVAGMMIQHIQNSKNREFGFDPESFITARLGLFEGSYKSSASRSQFIEDVLALLREQPEIAGASISSRLHMLYSDEKPTYMLEPAEGVIDANKSLRVYMDNVSTGYAESVGHTIIEGTDLSLEQFSKTGERPVLVSEEFAKRHIESGSIVGKKLRLEIEKTPRTVYLDAIVAGVIPDTCVRLPRDRPEDTHAMHMFVNIDPPRFMTIVARPIEGINPYALVPIVKRCVAEVDNQIPLYYIHTPSDAFEFEFAGMRFAVDLFVLFSAVALLLSFIGIFGITAFSIIGRIQEIGIRKSLGATGTEIFQLITRQGFIELLVGLSLGVLAGISLTYALNQVFSAMGLVDPVVYMTVIAILASSSLLASIYPARKAAMVGPAEATRVN